MNAEGRQQAVSSVDTDNEVVVIDFAEATTAPTEPVATPTVAQINTIEFDEASLAAASIDGCGESFEQLYTHYFPKVRALCMRKVGNVTQAEDIAQEAFAKAFERISDFGGPRHFGGWVGTIAANLCTDHLRRRKPVASVDQMMESESGVPSYEIDPIRNVQRGETTRLVRQALLRLDPRQREALVMHEVRGLSCAAVGQQLGISEVAAESLLARARRRLRKEVTAKAIPADLFGFGGLALIPTLARAWRRMKEAAELRAAWLHSGGGYEMMGSSMLPTFDAAKAAVVVAAAAFMTQFGAMDTAPVQPNHDSAVSAASVSFLAVDADETTNTEGATDKPSADKVNLDVDLSTSPDGYGASVEAAVDVEEEGESSDIGGANINIDVGSDSSPEGAISLADENDDEIASVGTSALSN